MSLFVFVFREPRGKPANSRPSTRRRFVPVTAGVIALMGLQGALWENGLMAADPGTPPRAARSVHWGWLGQESDLFYNEMIVDASVPGSYFMACGWNTGYFGIQELGDRRKEILFSVWDPTRGDNAEAVKPEERVECLYSDPAMRIRRFGGEGTGGQCLGDFPWSPGETNRFLMRATVMADKTAYAGYVFQRERNQWQHLVTFRTRTGGLPLKGYYSFIEDFRRDTQSAKETRSARFGHGWVKTLKGDWIALVRARFTASNAEWEAKESIEGAWNDGWFVLQTGGTTRNTLPVGSVLERPPVAGADLPQLDATAGENPRK